MFIFQMFCKANFLLEIDCASHQIMLEYGGKHMSPPIQGVVGKLTKCLITCADGENYYKLFFSFCYAAD